MGSVNQVMLLGNLGRDPELRYTPTGKPVATLSVATSRRWKDNGEVKEATDWHRVIVWGKQAEVAQEYLKKGSPVCIEGRLSTRSYDKDGDKRYVTEVVARRLQLVGKKDPDGEPPATEAPADEPTPAGHDEDDIPL